MNSTVIVGIGLITLTLSNPISASVTLAEYRQYSDEKKLAYVQGAMETMIYFTSKEATWKRNCIRDTEAQYAAAKDLNQELESSPSLSAERPINPVAISSIDAVCKARR